MSADASSENLTDCPAATPGFNFAAYLNPCTVCVVANADVAGLGIIVGILLQAALMNLCVILWWLAGPGPNGLGRDFLFLCGAVRCVLCSPRELFEQLRADYSKFGAAITRAESGAGFFHERLSEGRREFRRKLQKLFKAWSDAQAVTGIALLFAAILQNNGGDLSLYHTAIVLDLIAVAADGQAIMLFYAFKMDTTTSERAGGQAANPEALAEPAPPIEKPTSTTRKRLLNVDHGIWPRLVSSLVYLVLDFTFSFKSFFRFRDADECFLAWVPRTGNYGTWAIASAILVLCVYLPIFIPQEFLSLILDTLLRLVKRNLACLYSTPSAINKQDSRLQRSLVILKRLIGFFIAYVIWITGRLFEWILRREIAFPIGTLTYFFWNMVDIILLKSANQVLLVGGGGDEESFAAFGQIVPIVMVFAVVYPICDVMQERKAGEQEKKKAQPIAQKS